MFIIILIMRIINYFDNAILTEELKERVIKVGCPFHNFPNSGYFDKIFGPHFQKGLVYFYTKKILPLLLCFWNYNPSPNGQINSFINAQTHL